MMIKILVIIACAVLFWLGGRSWGNKMFRRIGIPILIALYIGIFCKWWLFFPCGAWLGLTIPIGYGEPTPDDDKPSFLGLIFRKGWLIRGVWGLIVALVSVWLFAFGYIHLGLMVAYLALNFCIGASLCALKAPDFIIEPLVGASLASLVLLI